MGLRQPSVNQGAQGVLPFDFDATDATDEVTGRAGLPLLLETMMALHVGQAVKQHLKLRKRNAGFSETEMVEDLVLLLGAGGECLDDLTILAADKGLLRLCDRDKLPSPDAARSFLLGFHDENLLNTARSENPADEASVIYPESAALMGLARVQEHVVAELSRHRPQSVATLEMDATIIESHKKQALPHYKGGRGYQPSLVYWVEQDLVVADEFRDGNVPAGKGPLEVVKRAFAALPAKVEHRRFRADSAAYEDSTLKWLADPVNLIERFTISADMTAPLRKLAESVASVEWKVYESRNNETVFFAEVDFQPGQWPKEAAPMRTLVLKIERRQADMFAEQGGIKYLGIVSNDFTLDGAALIKWHYRKAGCIEVVHDVVKNQLGGGVLPCAAFGANAAWFRLCLLTYNLLSSMKVIALPPPFEDARPKRLRFAVFNLSARLVCHARKLLARVAKCLVERADLLLGRARLRTAYAT
jgi:hypothetical protein